MTAIIFHGEVRYRPNGGLKHVFELATDNDIRIPLKYMSYIKYIYADITEGKKTTDLEKVFNCILALYTLRESGINCPKFIRKYVSMFVDSPQYYNNGHFLYMVWISDCSNVLKLIVGRPQYNPNDKPFEYIYFYTYDVIAKKATDWIRSQAAARGCSITHQIFDNKKAQFILRIVAKAPNEEFRAIEGKLYKIVNSVHEMSVKITCLQHIYRRSIALI